MASTQLPTAALINDTELRQYTGPFAGQLADWESLKADMVAVQEYCRLLCEELSKDPRSEPLTAALYKAAVVTYGRCFGEGRRLRLRVDQIDDVEGDAQGAHDYYWNLRHKLIAHPVNAFEGATVCVVSGRAVGEASQPATVVIHHRLTSGDAQAVMALSDLAAAFQRHIEGEATKLFNRIDEVVRTMSEADVEKLRPFRIPPLDREAAGKDRPWSQPLGHRRTGQLTKRR